MRFFVLYFCFNYLLTIDYRLSVSCDYPAKSQMAVAPVCPFCSGQVKSNGQNRVRCTACGKTAPLKDARRAARVQPEGSGVGNPQEQLHVDVQLSAVDTSQPALNANVEPVVVLPASASEIPETVQENVAEPDLSSTTTNDSVPEDILSLPMVPKMLAVVFDELGMSFTQPDRDPSAPDCRDFVDSADSDSEGSSLDDGDSRFSPRSSDIASAQVFCDGSASADRFETEHSCFRLPESEVLVGIAAVADHDGYSVFVSKFDRSFDQPLIITLTKHNFLFPKFEAFKADRRRIHANSCLSYRLGTLENIRCDLSVILWFSTGRPQHFGHLGRVLSTTVCDALNCVDLGSPSMGIIDCHSAQGSSLEFGVNEYRSRRFLEKLLSLLTDRVLEWNAVCFIGFQRYGQKRSSSRG
jgi:hypothetical protein